MHLRPIVLLGIITSMVIGVMTGVLAYRALGFDRAFMTDGQVLAEIVDRVGEHYVEEIPRQQLIDDAIDGMLRGLDEHSAFLDTMGYEDAQEQATGRFGGIGIEIGIIEGYFTVLSPIDDTPAARAGLVAGDRIVQIDHRSMRGRTLMDAVLQLRGAPDTEVHVRIRREGEGMGGSGGAEKDADEVFDLVLTRAIIEVASVRGRLLEPDYGYLRISQFQSRTGDDLADAVDDLKRENGGDLAGLVVDLRNNPGGVLGASVAVADAFLADGLIVYTESRVSSRRLRFAAKPNDILNGAPLAVLINRGSASAAEVVAGALQDHGRALVLGTKSFGKGTVQSMIPLAGDRAIKITTARYFTPNGRSIHDEGIEPDIEVPYTGGETYEEFLFTRALNALKHNSG